MHQIASLLLQNKAWLGAYHKSVGSRSTNGTSVPLVITSRLHCPGYPDESPLWDGFAWHAAATRMRVAVHVAIVDSGHDHDSAFLVDKTAGTSQIDGSKLP